MFTTADVIVEGESIEDFNALMELLTEEHEPRTTTESILVQSMAQHHWFSQRAVRLQNANIENDKRLALYMRYQSVNDRAFSKCLSDLLKLRAERRKEQIGFESQNACKPADNPSAKPKNEPIPAEVTWPVPDHPAESASSAVPEAQPVADFIKNAA